MRFPSLQFPNLRYVVGWNDDAFRVTGGMHSLSYYDTCGDGDTQHSPAYVVKTLVHACDAVRSAMSAAQKHASTMDCEALSQMAQAFEYRTEMSIADAWDCVDAAMQHDDKGQAYRHKGKITRRAACANLRDAEPIPRLAPDCGNREKLQYALTWYVKHPNIFEHLRAMLALSMSERFIGASYSIMQEIGASEALPPRYLMDCVRYAEKLSELAQAARTVRWYAEHAAETIEPMPS